MSLLVPRRNAEGRKKIFRCEGKIDEQSPHCCCCDKYVFDQVTFPRNQQFINRYQKEKNHTLAEFCLFLGEGEVIFQTPLQIKLRITVLLYCIGTLYTCCPDNFFMYVFKGILKAATPNMFEMAKNRLDMFQQKYPVKGLASWWTWWEKRKSYIFGAFKLS